MRTHLCFFSALFPLLLLGCPSETSSVCEPTCDQNPDGSTPDGSSSGGDGGDGSVPIPVGCDPNADPKDAPKCVVSEFGIFVDATTGNDGNTGSKELPMKSITEALKKLNGRPRIYVCEGTYPESVKLSAPVSIYGGFACGSWEYTGTQPKVAPGVAGAEAIVVENVKSRVFISDVHAEAAPGDATKKNSIAMKIVASSEVKLVRMKATAGAGFDGMAGDAGTTGQLDKPPGGNKAEGGPGAAKTCTCTSGGSTAGGGGGVATQPGQPGVPTHPPTSGNDGAGGLSASCVIQEPNGNGNIGADAPNQQPASAVTTLGTLVDNAWLPSSGMTGASGAPGQGGGGGGGNGDNGGGGACGGCGGTGGQGGEGGGASLALLSIQSVVAIVNSAFETGAGGVGGAGGAGGVGGSGGTGGAGLCLGGDGGKGGSGGGGSGGAGGLSVGILWEGTEPTRDEATNVAITVGAAGGGGQGGAPGTNDGPTGKSEKVMGL